MWVCELFIMLVETKYAKSEHSTAFGKILGGICIMKRKKLLTVFMFFFFFEGICPTQIFILMIRRMR